MGNMTVVVFLALVLVACEPLALNPTSLTESAIPPYAAATQGSVESGACLPSVRSASGSARSFTTNRITWGRTAQVAGCSFHQITIAFEGPLGPSQFSTRVDSLTQTSDGVRHWDHVIREGHGRARREYEVLVTSTTSCGPDGCSGPSSSVFVTNGFSETQVPTIPGARNIPWIQLQATESFRSASRRNGGRHLHTPAGDSVSTSYLSGSLQWGKSEYAAATPDSITLRYDVQESVKGGSWRTLRPYTVNRSLPDTIYQTPRAQNYTYGTAGGPANDRAGELLGMARMTSNTEHRFRVRHAGGTWSELLMVRTPAFNAMIDPPPVVPPVIPSGLSFNCRDGEQNRCTAPAMPDVDVEYGPGRAVANWTPTAGGWDYYGREIPANRLSIVDQSWRACPFLSFSQESFRNSRVPDNCSGGRSGSGNRFTGGFSPTVGAWKVRFQARAKSPNRGSQLGGGSASLSPYNWTLATVLP